MKKYYQIFLILIFVLAFVLRFYKLSNVPFGFYQDESAIGYNAFSILETGKDEYAKIFPLYFKSFGDWKLPVYIYAAAISVKAFGLNEFAVRFPSALFGFLCVILSYFLTKKLSNDKTLSLITAFLLAVNPWSLFYNRATFEVSLAQFFFLAGSYLLLNYQKKAMFLLGTLFFILAMYSYNLTRLLAPLLYASVLFFKKDILQKSGKIEKIITVFLSLFFLSPLILSLFQSGGISSAKGTFLFTSNAVIAPLIELRGYFIHLPVYFTKTFFNIPLLLIWQYLKNVLSYFSVPFYFISGSTHGNHGIGLVGQFYLFEFITIILGFYKLIINKPTFRKFILLWFLLTVLIAAMTRESPHATRSFFLTYPLELASAYGLLSIIKYLFNLTNIKYKLMLSIFCLLFIGYNFINYFTSYYFYFPVAYAKSWRSQDKPLAKYLRDQEKIYDKIIIDDDSNFIYTSILFFQKYDPLKFQSTIKRQPDDNEGFSKVISFGKYRYEKINWGEEEKISAKRLYVTGEESEIPGFSLLKTFRYPLRPVALSLKEEIRQFSVEEVAYKVYEKNPAK